ncbi:MAG: hypothetical protein KF734_05665 [Saprospiraceae bacterium]|nr:hypothetical protein [Saprospiraceae bacterium]
MKIIQINQGNPCLANRQVQILFNPGITIELRGGKFSDISGRILSGERLQDHNTFDHPEKVKPAVFMQAALKENVVTLKMPSFSVVVLSVR